METNKKIDKKPIDDNEPVTITQGQLKGILSELETLKGNKPNRPQKVDTNIATIRFYENKPVVWYGNIREKKVDGERIGYADIKVIDDDKPKTVEYLEFLNSPNQVKVEIKDQRAKRVEDVVDTIRSRNLDEHFRKKFTSEEIDMVVVKYEYEADIEVLDGTHKGEKYTVDVNCLNS